MLSNSAGRTGNCDLGPDPTLSTRVAQRMVKRRRRAQGAPGPRARVTKQEGGRGRGHLNRSGTVFGFVWHGFFLFAWPIFVVALLCRCACLLCSTRAALRQARATLAARETPL